MDENQVNEFAKCLGHDIRKMVKKTKNKQIENLINKSYDGYKGTKLLKSFRKILEESRYPVPKSLSYNFPDKKHKGIYWQPIFSSGLAKFCYALGRQILKCLNQEFSINISNKEIRNSISRKFDISKNTEERFYRIFFDKDIR